MIGSTPRISPWIGLCFIASTAFGHEASSAFLTLSWNHDGRIEGRWSIPLVDLEAAIGLDTDGDGAVTWRELKARHGTLARYALGHLILQADDETCIARASGHQVRRVAEETHALMLFYGHCDAKAERLRIRYTLLFELDPTHRGFISVSTGARESTLAVASPQDPMIEINLDPPSPGGFFARVFGMKIK